MNRRRIRKNPSFLLRHSGHCVHTISYRQASHTSSTVPAVNTAIGGASATTSSSRLRRTTHSPSSSRKANKAPKRSSDLRAVDDLWTNGQCSKAKSMLNAALNESISSMLTINDLSLNAIFLLRILNGLNLHWYDLFCDTNAMSNQQNGTVTLTSKGEFASTKLTSKVNRQLQDPVVIMMGQIPAWITEMGLLLRVSISVRNASDALLSVRVRPRTCHAAIAGYFGYFNSTA